jgi:hypothetical protein
MVDTLHQPAVRWMRAHVAPRIDTSVHVWFANNQLAVP